MPGNAWSGRDGRSRQASRPSTSPASGMYVAGYGSSPSAAATNPVAAAALAMGIVSMVCQLIPAVGMFVAIPMSVAAMAAGTLGLRMARMRGGYRMDFAAGGLVMGMASIVLSIAVLALVRGATGGPAMASVDQSNEESLEALAASSAAMDARSDIMGASWGTGKTRRTSSEVISLDKDGGFSAWTKVDGEDSAEWGGSYSLLFGKEALAAVDADASDAIMEEVMGSPSFMERNVVLIEMDVEGTSQTGSPDLVMIGHYLPDEHSMYLRDATDVQGSPTVLHRLSDKESGI